MMQNLCNLSDQRLLEQLKKEILSVPNLAIPDPSRRFYIKTDWSKYGMGAVILQADVSAETRRSEAQENYGVKREFENSLERMRL